MSKSNTRSKKSGQSGKSPRKSEKSGPSYISAAVYSSIGRIPEEEESQDSIQQGKQELRKNVLSTFEWYLKLLFGRKTPDSHKVGGLYKMEELLSHKSHYQRPDGILTFPNPDYPQNNQVAEMKPLEAIELIQKMIKLDSSLDSMILLKAIEGVYTKLNRDPRIPSPTNNRPYTSINLVSVEESQLVSAQRVVSRNPEKKTSIHLTLNLNKNKLLVPPQASNRLKRDPIYLLMSKLSSQLNSFEGQTNRNIIHREGDRQPKPKNVMNKIMKCLTLDLTKLNKMKPRQLALGGYFNQVNGQWQRTSQDTGDYLTLIRNSILIMLSKNGFIVNSFLSSTGEYIYCTLSTTEENLHKIANQHKIKKQLNFWFSDLFSLEPVDQDLRPLRLNNRLWKPQEYQLTAWFLYMRGMIIEKIESINFKKLARETNLTHLNSQLFTYGKNDFFGAEVAPTDDEWYAYYQYLVHLDKFVNEFRKDYRIDSDIASILNKELDPFDLYVKRNKDQATLSELNKGNMNEPQNEKHRLKIRGIQDQVEHIVDSYKIYMIQDNIPLTKYIKILKKETLAQNYYQIFQESLSTVNTQKVVLQTVWDRLDLDPIEPFVCYNEPSKGTAPSLQAQQIMCWCKYAINEDNQISLFSTTERLKLTYKCISDCLSVNDLLSKQFVHQIFCLHSHYELFGHCNNFHNVMTSQAQFFKKQLFYLQEEWKTNYQQPWLIPWNLISQYYGEKIGLYFYFSAYFIELLFPQSIFGIVCSLVQWIAWDDNSQVYVLITMVFAFIQVHWTNLLCDLWDQRKALFNIKQGQMGKEKSTTKRSNFDGLHTRNIEDDDLNSVEQSTKNLLIKMSQAAITLILLLGLYSGIVVGLFSMSQSLKQNYTKELDAVPILALEVSLSAAINVLLLVMLEKYYDDLCISLTDYENHSTVQDYETSFVIKKFSLQFCSYVGPLLFVAFLNKQADLYCSANNCQTYVKYQFSCIIIYLTFIRIFKSIKIIYNCAQLPQPSRYDDNQQDLSRFIEDQAAKSTYSISMERDGILENYLPQFASTSLLSLFGYSFPFSYFLVFIQSIVQLQADKSRYLYEFQRSWPQNENSLGVWESILILTSYMSLLANSGTITILYAHHYDYQLLTVFIGIIMFNCFVKIVITSVFGQVSFGKEQLIKRQQYILRSTMDQFKKGKGQTSSTSNQMLQTWPIYKVFGSLNKSIEGYFETISSQSDLEDYFIPLIETVVPNSNAEPPPVQQQLEIQFQYPSVYELSKREQDISEENVSNAITPSKSANRFNSKPKNKKKQKSKQHSYSQSPVYKGTATQIKFSQLVPSTDVTTEYFSKQLSYWAFKLKKPKYSKSSSNTNKLQDLFKLKQLSTYRKIWTEERLTLRALYFRRKHLLLRNLYYYIVSNLKPNFNTMMSYYQTKFAIKHRKQFKELDTSRLEDHAELQRLELKQDKYTQKHAWINSRKVYVVKVKGVWFNGFRKSIRKQPSLKTMLQFYQRIKLIEQLKPKSTVHSEFDNLVDLTKIHTYTTEKVLDIITQLTIIPPEVLKVPITTRPLKMINYLASQQQSKTFNFYMTSFRDTFVFDTQTTKLQESIFQFYQEEQFPYSTLKILKYYSDDVWLANNGQPECNQLLKFNQLKHGQQLQPFMQSVVNNGVFYAEASNYIRLANIVDMIDDFNVKGYAAQLYDIRNVFTLQNVIKYRKNHGIPYSKDELNQFLYANLLLFCERSHGDINSKSYYYTNRQYALTQSNINDSSDIKNLGIILIEMIRLQPVDNLLKELETLQHPLKYIINDMINGEVTAEQVLGMIAQQQKFVEILISDLNHNTIEPISNKQLSQFSINTCLRENLHKININIRMKFYNQAHEIMTNLEEDIAILHFRQNQSALECFCGYLDNKLTEYLLCSKQLKLIRNLILVFYYKFALQLQLKNHLEENEQQLTESLQVLFLHALKEQINTVETILKCLSLNIKLEQLNDVQLHTLLKSKQSENSQFFSLPQQTQLKILDALRKKQEYIKALQSHKKYCVRFTNQINALMSLHYYFNMNFGFASLTIEETIQSQVILLKGDHLPEILVQPKDLTCGVLNYDQSSPVEEEWDFALQTNFQKDFNIELLFEADPDYCRQYLVFKYISLLIQFDDKDAALKFKLKEFLSLSIVDPVFTYLSNQLKAMTLQPTCSEYINQQNQCQIGKYISVQLIKWIELSGINSELNFTTDHQYFWKQVMSYSHLKNSQSNKRALRAGLEYYNDKSQINIQLRIRLIHHLLQLSEFHYPNLSADKFNDITGMDSQIKLSTRITELQTLHKQFSLPDHSWFHHDGLCQLKLYHMLSICFTYSPKHFENANLEDTQLLDIAGLTISMMSIKGDLHPIVMKKSQILQIPEQRLLFEEYHTDFQMYQCINSYINLNISQQKYLDNALNVIYTQIKQEKISPSILMMILIQNFITTQQFDMADILITFCLKLQGNAPIFNNSYDGFETDLKILHLQINHNHINIITPYDLLVTRKIPLKYCSDAQFYCQASLYHTLYSNNFEAVQEGLKNQLKWLNDSKELKSLLEICQTFLLLINSILGDSCTDLIEIVHVYHHQEGTLLHMLIQHLLCRYYINTNDYELALECSMKVLNYIYSSELHSCVIVWQSYNKQVIQYLIQSFYYNTSNNLIHQMIQPIRINIVELDSDILYSHLFDDMLVKEACMNHLDILTNLYEQLPPLSVVFQLLAVVDDVNQQAYLLKVISQYFFAQANEEGLNKFRAQLITNYQQRMQQLARKKKKLEKRHNNRKMLHQLTENDLHIYQDSIGLIDYELNIYLTFLKGLTLQNILSWSISASEKSAKGYEQIAHRDKLQTHYQIANNQLLQSTLYQQLGQLQSAYNAFRNGEEILSIWFGVKKHPSKGLVFFKMALLKQWMYTQYLDWCQWLLDVQRFNEFECRYILSQLLCFKKQVINCFDQYDVNQNQEEWIIGLRRILKQDKMNITDQCQDKQELGIKSKELLDTLIMELPGCDFTGMQQLLDADNIFAFFQQNNQFRQSTMHQIAKIQCQQMQQ